MANIALARPTAGPKPADRALTVLVAPGDPTGFPIGHAYVEDLYLPIVGPSSYVLLRFLDRLADRHPDSFTVTLDELAHRLGLGNNGAANRTTRTIERLCSYRLAVRIAADSIVLPRRLPVLSNRQLDRLAPHLAQLDRRHRLALDDSVRSPTLADA